MQLIVRSNTLAGIALCAALCSRALTEVGLPKLIDHLHFFAVALGFILILTNKRADKFSPKFNIALYVLLTCLFLSAAINDAGLINIALEFLLISEPLLLFAVLTSIAWRRSSLSIFQALIFTLVITHAIFAYFQFFVMGLRGDDVKGLFLSMGAGHHVAGALAATAATFYLKSSYIQSKQARIALFIFLTPIVIVTDAKQVVAVFLVSLLLFALTKIKDVRRLITLLAIFASTAVTLTWVANTIFPALLVWAKLDILIEGIHQKLSVVAIITSYYDSVFNLLFGLGPGHTVGRLGWMLPAYGEYLMPLGATTSEVTNAVWAAHQSHYMSNITTGSSMFSLFFSWAGFWGDLGLVGLASYLYLWLLVWRTVSDDEVSGFLFLTIFVFGAVFSWMEEPGYMLFVVSVLGLRWQELRVYNTRYNSRSQRRVFFCTSSLI